MKDYSDIGLTQKFRNINSLSEIKGQEGLKEYIDGRINDITRPGGLNYTNITAMGREYKAVVSLDNKLGNFDDIQNAINYTNNLGGGNILIKAGTYIVSGTTSLYNNIELLGEDNDTTVINFNNGTALFYAQGVAGTRLRNIHINNLQFRNSAQSDLGAITFDYTDNLSVINCKFNNNYSSSAGNGGDIAIRNSTRALVEHCFSGTSGDFVFSNLSNLVLIKNNHCIGGTSLALNSDGGTQTMFFANVVERMAGGHLNIDSNDISIIGNHLRDGTTTSINVANVHQRLIISNNIINTNGTATRGIHISADTDNSIINNNIIWGTPKIGIWLDDGDNNIIQGNRILDATTGILIDATCDRTIIIGNQLTGCATALTDNGTNGTNVGNITT